jgi:hypothetical protein
VTTTANISGPTTVRVVSPAELLAWQLTADNISTVAAWADNAPYSAGDDGEPAVLWLSGEPAHLGDWVMRGILGKYFVADPEFYAQHYAPVAR